MLFLMGGFAFFCGICYNDFFAIPLKLFGSCWDENFEKTSPDCTVVMGVDPIWYQTAAEVTFINSLKMKLSIVIGVIHMSWGIIMRAINNIHFGDWLGFIFEFIPYILFFMFTFGYMVAAIIIKWTTNWDHTPPPPIINIYTAGGQAGPGFVLWGDDQGVEQTKFQQQIFLIAVCLVPLMLFPKPILGHFCCKKKSSAPSGPSGEETQRPLLEEGQEMTGAKDVATAQTQAHDEEHEEPFGEVMIHQMIETIEFVLGCISNTASYLR